MKRLHNLDYLRGLAAFGILLYHYLSWTIGRFDSESTIGRIGLYGVSIFYILSGLTLFIVYYEKMNFSKNEIIGFIKKRVFRIFPLMWLVVIISILFSQKVPNVYDLIMNLTGLFGFINWDKYFAIGLWSIGNELVFYSFFILVLCPPREFGGGLSDWANGSCRQYGIHVDPVSALFLQSRARAFPYPQAHCFSGFQSCVQANQHVLEVDGKIG